MLTDAALRNLKPKSLTYKVSDRGGMYVAVSPANTVTFRYDYRLNGRCETLTIGRYGPSGIFRLSFSLRSTAVHVQCDLESHDDARGRRRQSTKVCRYSRSPSTTCAVPARRC